MKATKLIINGEEQNLGQVSSVNGQTGDVAVPGKTIITYNYNENEYMVREGALRNGDLVIIRVNETDEPTSSITIDGETYDVIGYDENNGRNWSS